MQPGDADWQRYRDALSSYPGLRSVIAMDIDRIAGSCGYAVPRDQFRDHRTQLNDYAERKDEAALAEYRAEKNAKSIDGLPGL